MSAVRVALLDDYQGVAPRMGDWSALGPEVEVHSFRDHLANEQALAARLTPFAVIVAMRERTPFPESLLTRLPALRLLITTGMANASIDVDAATRLGIVVSGTRSLKSPPTELTWALILALARRLPAEHEAIRRGEWQTSLGIGLQDKVLGVMGLGSLGSQVAGVGRAFGMGIIAWSQNLTVPRAEECGAALVSKDELLARSDVLTIHLRLSARTRGLIGARELAMMKPTAYLVNTSRGPIVDEEALLGALTARRIGGAGLDVFDEEPLPRAHPFRSLDNVVLTPHIGYVTRENYELYYQDAADGVRAFLAGTPMRLLNPHVLRSPGLRLVPVRGHVATEDGP
jgi:phosphoglycerate dehydrogenase-like enzyme